MSTDKEDGHWSDPKTFEGSPTPSGEREAVAWRDYNAEVADFHDKNSVRWHARATTAEAQITSLQQQVAELKGALEPFSAYAVTSISHDAVDGAWVIRLPDNSAQPAFAHFTGARAMLSASQVKP